MSHAVVVAGPHRRRRQAPTRRGGRQHALSQRLAAQGLDQIAAETRRPVTADQVALGGTQKDDGLALTGPDRQGFLFGARVVDQGHAGLTRHPTARGLDLIGRRPAHEGVRRADRHGQPAQKSRSRLGVGHDRKLSFKAKASAGTIRPILDHGVAAHGAGQPSHHRQAQARSVEPRGVRNVGVSELLKDAAARRFGHAGSGVVDDEGQARRRPIHAFADCLNRQAHSAPVGELHGVSRQVEQDLPQATLIGDDIRGVGGDRPDDLQPLVVGAWTEQFGHAAHQAF